MVTGMVCVISGQQGRSGLIPGMVSVISGQQGRSGLIPGNIRPCG
jgi:hypothetical protein